jgi:hypothetical protein
MVMIKALKDDGNERHHRLDEAELQSGLFAKTEMRDCVRFATEATRAVNVTRFDRFATYFAHYVAFASEIFVTQTQKVVNYERWKNNV